MLYALGCMPGKERRIMDQRLQFLSRYQIELSEGGDVNSGPVP